MLLKNYYSKNALSSFILKTKKYKDFDLKRLKKLIHVASCCIQTLLAAAVFYAW